MKPALLPGSVGRWSRGSRCGAAGRVVAAVGLVLLAYHYSLATLVHGVTLQTPLAYLGLLPVLALVAAAAKARPAPDEPEIHDRQLDWIVGVPLLAAAVVVLALLPGRMSTVYWQQRVDLLSLPLFCAGAIAVLFGVRALGRLKLAIGVLFLAWPFVYTALLEHVDVSAATLLGLRVTARHFHMAEQVAGTDGSVFALGRGARRFVVSVASPCSGVNGILGFLLAGGGSLALVRGGGWRKLGWLAVGTAVTWSLNLVRIVAIFAVGDRWGQGASLRVLHPYLGLVTFSLGLLAMLLVMPAFGLAPPPRRPARSGSRRPGGHAPAVPRATPALVLVSLVALSLAVADHRLSSFGLIAEDLGGPRLASFSASPAAMPGWSVRQLGRFDWTRPYFGADSSWLRYQYVPSTAPASPARPRVIADVVLTSLLGSFDTYGLQACYRFHRYQLGRQGQVGLGAGLVGETTFFRLPQERTDWSVVAWIWPVRTAAGARYERVVLLAPGRAANSFLVGFARDLLRRQALASARRPAAGGA